MNKGDKLIHSNLGPVKFIEKMDEDLSLVQLPNGILKEVTTAMLSKPKPEAAKPEAK